MLVLETPGHTRGHISYWFPDGEALFCGDTLFALGCGRLFEGDAADHVALARQADGPARRDPGLLRPRIHAEQRALRAWASTRTTRRCARRAAEIEAVRERRGEPTIPTTIGVEKATNPFLRAADPALRRALGLEGASDAEVFAEIRRRKDQA